MRKENAGFRTAFLSEEGTKLLNRDYFAYVEMDDFACYVAADSLDGEKETNSAKIVVESVLREFTEHPSMNSFSIKRNIQRAHRELLDRKDGMRLRASVSVTVTDYVKCRYVTVGNSRFGLIRNDRILYESKDQSLTETLVEGEVLPRDKAARHEERNNLYSFLGQNRGKPEIRVSRKRKLANGDILLNYTRGVWENCDRTELLDAAKDVGEPQELADNVEELVLGKQKQEIDNYTIAVTFVDKVYLNPKKRWTWKKVLTIVLPVAAILLVLGIVLFVRHRIRSGKEADMRQYMENAGQYADYGNYEKASEEYGQAAMLAKELKKEEEQEQIDALRLLADQVLLADKCLEDGDYGKALDLYEKALELSQKNAGAGKDYIVEQTERARSHMEIMELLETAEGKEEYGDYAGAAELYRQAKQMASALHDKDARAEALEKQRAAEETLEQLRQGELEELEKKIQAAIEEGQVAQELENQSLMNDKKNALELESKGNELMKKEDYASAIPYFETAKGMYGNLEMPERVQTLEEQMEACRQLAEEAERKAAEEAARQSAEDAAAEEAKQAAEEARKAMQEMKDAEKDKALEEAQKAAEEAKKAVEELKKALEENKGNQGGNNGNTGGNGMDGDSGEETENGNGNESGTGDSNGNEEGIQAGEPE